MRGDSVVSPSPYRADKSELVLREVNNTKRSFQPRPSQKMDPIYLNRSFTLLYTYLKQVMF